MRRRKTALLPPAFSDQLRRISGGALMVLAALAIGGVVIRITGGNPLEAYAALFSSATSWPRGIAGTLAKTIPLLLTGLAVSIGLRAGLLNIGAEGQLYLGAIAAAAVGILPIPLPFPFPLILALAAGALAGALWAAAPGLLKSYRGVHEVISTILLNYVAIHLTHWLVIGPLKAPGDIPQTPPVIDAARLPALVPNTGLSLWILVAAGAAVWFWYYLFRTPAGYELRAVGLNSDAARAAGIPVRRTILSAMCLSGALAGLGGAVEVLGVHGRFFDQFSPGYGFDSIAVALLGGSAPIGVALSALLFGALRRGALGMELLTDTPQAIVFIVQAVVILFVGLRVVRKRAKSLPPEKREERKEESPEACHGVSSDS